MKKPFTILLLFLCALCLVACQAPFTSVTYGGGDGSAPDKAVVIQGASDERAGVHAEYEWIATNYPGAKKLGQSLVSFGGKLHDVIVIKTSSDQEKKLYFDISGFFGKGGY